jgi:hypothetical protein
MQMTNNLKEFGGTPNDDSQLELVSINSELQKNPKNQ